jgi:DNA-binding CsgD family transcriptional regulator/tetratricopeptide (TPR) repeat protein
VEALLERGLELAELDAAIDLATGGNGRLVVVEGPAGIGKSRLLAEARRRAEASMRVLSARGSELEGEFAFGVVRQLLEGELRAPERRGTLLAAAAGSAAPVFGAPGGTDGEGASFAALHGLFWLASNLAEERPLLLAVDDLHWCDRPSLLFLAYLARRLESQRILLVVGLRDAEPGTDAALLGEIANDAGATSIRPGPLSEAGVAARIEERLGAAPDREFVDACHASTGGNPLLVDQLLTALRGEGVRPDAAHVARVAEIGPRAVSRTVLLRLARLAPDARLVARASAVLGDGAAPRAVAELAGVDDARVAEATGALAQAEILRPDLPLTFVHALVRDAVYYDVAPAERELQHARAASLLRDAGAPIEQVAAQLLHASPRGAPWASELLWEAGRAAMQAGAADSAVAYLQRALEGAAPGEQQGSLLLELGTAEALTSGPAAAEHLAQAYDALSDPATRGVAAGLLGRTLLFMGTPEDAAAIARRAARELPDELADMRMGLEALEHMTVVFGAGDPAFLTRLRAYRGQHGDGPGARMLAAMAAWESACTDGTAADSAELALAALAGGQLRAADPALIVFAAIVTLVVADRPEAAAMLDEAMAEAHRRGSLFSASSTLLWQGFSDWCTGDLPTAEDRLRAAADELARWGHAGAAAALSHCFLARVLHERGRPAEALRLVEQIGTADPGQSTTHWWLGTRAALLTAAGRAEEAVAATDQLAAQYATLPDVARLWWRSLKAEALDRLGRREEALALMHEELEVTRTFGAPSWLGRTLRILGTLERDAGLEHLQEAVTVLGPSTARLEHAKALAALGGALRRARRPTEAREPLRRALELAGVCGADALAGEVRSELQAAGARPRRDALRGVASLTPSERRVVDLAASGRTNRDIAQVLYVTPKTVEVHLSSAYRKLEIGSRRELERALALP